VHEPDEDPFGEDRYPFLYLDIERPSAGRDSALVHAGRQFALLAGSGSTRRWERAAGAGWGETDDLLLSWIS